MCLKYRQKFIEICIDKTLNAPILVHSKRCRETCKNLRRWDFERTNIGPFKAMSRDLQKFTSMGL
uniref:Uncharacterized protein n=1 Tax=viral metagenome TaxID=1070528 RepID=A0A6C0CBS1_9ZZZZ